MRKRIKDLGSPACDDLNYNLKKLSKDNALDFSRLINPFGNPFEKPDFGLDFSEVIRDASGRLIQYPDNRYCEFRDAVASFLGNIIPAQVVPGNGSCELVKLVLECVVNEGDSVAILQPAVNLYEKYCRVLGAEIIHLMEADLGNIDASFLQSIKVLFLSNPSEVSGELRGETEIKKLAEICTRSNTLLFVNESCIDLVDNAWSAVSLTASDNHLFVLRSLGVMFAIPGIRIGFGITSPEMANHLNAARLSWNLGAVSEIVAVSLLKRHDLSGAYLVKSREYISENREYLVTSLNKVRKFSVVEGNSHYVLVDISSSSIGSHELTNRLAAAGIMIKDCSNYYSMGDDYIRISVRPKNDIDRLIKEIGIAIVDSAREKAINELADSLLSPDFSATGSNRNCPYYPCHFPDQDCTFCFCPFYPCGEEKTGGKWVERSSGGNVWSCEGCELVHHPDTAEKLIYELKGNSPMEEKLIRAWNRVVEPIL